MRPRAPDPHNLRAMTSAMPAPVFEADRPCLGCGYNLRGLAAGVKCPECGMASVLPADIDDPLALMPRPVIVAFIWGCWAASFCVVGTVAAVIAARIPDLDPRIGTLSLVALSLLWLIATRLLTPEFAIPQAVFRGFAPASRLRKAARWLQLGWFFAAASAALAGLLSNPSSSSAALLNLVFWIGFLIGMAGVVALCILMERLADWTRDDTAQNMFNWAMWGLPILTPLLMLDLPTLSSPRVVTSLLSLVWVVVAGMFPYGLLSLSKSVTLSIVHSFEHEERTQRRNERDRRYHRYIGKLVDKMDREP